MTQFNNVMVTLSINKEYYANSFISFMLNDGIRRQQRHGLEADGNSGQPFKFGGKELVSANGINEFDYGARRLYLPKPKVLIFTSRDL